MLLFVAITVVGHIGKEVVERKCEVEYFAPTTLIPKVTYFFALHPVEAFLIRYRGSPQVGTKPADKSDLNTI